MDFWLKHGAFRETVRFDRDWILRLAADSLQADLVHITDSVAPLSPGSPHDYYSNGDYWWPDPNTADGVPYINRDGESNPANFEAHRRALRRLRTLVANLTAAYRLTGAAPYATKAVQLLQEFFLDPATRMNPHLCYAQAIPGICTGRGVGIIDTLHLVEVPVAIAVLQDSPFLTGMMYSDLRQWFADYLLWMSTHSHGIDEMNAKNNHSVCWLVQAAVFARFTGNLSMLEFCRRQYRENLLPNQMMLDGSFPLELKRTKPYSYSIFVLDNLVTLCHVLSEPAEDLWSFQLPDGRGIARGLEFLYPYLVDKDKWPYPPDIQHFEGWPVRIPGLLFGGIALNQPNYLELWEKLNPDPVDPEIRRNIAIRQPLLWV